MQRIVTGIIAVLVIFAVAVISAPYIISTNTIRAEITDRLEKLTGKKVTFQGETTLSYNPYLGIEVFDLKLQDTDLSQEEVPLLGVEKIETKIELLPLLTGSVEIKDFKLLRPKLSLKVYPDGKENWTLEKGQLRNAFQTKIANRKESKNTEITSETLGSLTVQDGIIEYANLPANKEETITNINGTIEWADLNNPMLVAGNGIWRGEGITTNFEVADTIELLSGGESSLSIELNSQPLELTFVGQANMLADLFLKGELDVNTPSIARLTQVLEINIGNLNNLQNWSASGQLEATLNNINLSEATFAIGENEASGVIRITNDEETGAKLNGTFAFETVDLQNSFESGSTLNIATPLQVKDMDIDLRISAQALNFGAIALDNVAASILTNDDGWVFDIGNSNAFNGIITAKLGQRVEDQKRQSFLDIAATRIDTESLMDTLGEQPIKLTGEASFTSSIRTNALDKGLSNLGLNGDFEGEITIGQLSGIDIPNLLNEETTNEQIKLTTFDKDNQTSFETMQLKFFLNKGVATIAQTEITTTEQKFRILGDVDTNYGNMNIQVQERLEEIPNMRRLKISGTTQKPSFSLQEGPKQAN